MYVVGDGWMDQSVGGSVVGHRRQPSVCPVQPTMITQTTDRFHERKRTPSSCDLTVATAAASDSGLAGSSTRARSRPSRLEPSAWSRPASASVLTPA